MAMLIASARDPSFRRGQSHAFNGASHSLGERLRNLASSEAIPQRGIEVAPLGLGLAFARSEVAVVDAALVHHGISRVEHKHFRRPPCTQGPGPVSDVEVEGHGQAVGLLKGGDLGLGGRGVGEHAYKLNRLASKVLLNLT